ncbi:FkbM family methyltransferase [Candidatus Bathyarchaeota archaeon]|nr:MAG: FkbM family methyltransferase [Candidatus Bathyarchaeota archaeon]
MTDWRFIWEKHVKGQHGPREASTQKQILRLHGKHAVDIGASVGEYTFPLTRRFRWVHAFEPNPGKLSRILVQASRRREWAKIILYPFALSDTHGETNLFLDPDGREGFSDTIMPVFNYNPGLTVREPHTFLGQKAISIKTRTYDAYFKNTSVDLVKIDVEGAEFKVLEGAREALENRMVKRLVVELHDKTMQPQLLRLMEGYGFKIRILDDHPRIYCYLN